jgi:hypothetical protein
MAKLILIIDLSNTITHNGSTYARVELDDARVKGARRRYSQRRWTPEEDAKLKEMASLLISTAGMAKNLRRTLHAVYSRLSILNTHKGGTTHE